MKPFATATVAILALVAIVHVVRLLAGWSVSVNGIDIPMWVASSLPSLLADWQPGSGEKALNLRDIVVPMS